MASQKANRKVIISGMLGNGLEWYDYALYGILAPTFSTLFFPSTGDETDSLIKTYLAFAVGFIFRPLGAVIFGRIGDRYGRKKALVTSMILMACATGCLGLLPTYDMIGYFSPALLILIRIIQGISLGGAFSGAMSYVVEHAPSNRRGAIGSTTMLSLVIGFLTGSLVAAVVSTVMPAEDFAVWGWRLPFFVGVGIGFVGYYIRHHGEESPAYEEAKEAGSLSQRPVYDTFVKYPWTLLQAFNAYVCVTIPFYLLAIYMISYSETFLHMSKQDALLGNAASMVAMFLPIYWAGKLADRVGRRTVLLGATFAMMAAAYPCFELMHTEVLFNEILAQCILSLILGIYLAPIPAMLVEIFPTSIRYTGMSLSYNFCAIIGGLTPTISLLLIEYTGNSMSILWLLIGAAVLSSVSLLFYKDRWKEKLG